MNAIDFSCNLLRAIYKSKLSESELRVTFCVAAGLHSKESITSFLYECSPSSATAILHRLRGRGILTRTPRTADSYKLTEYGRMIIANILSFMPQQLKK